MKFLISSLIFITFASIFTLKAYSKDIAENYFELDLEDSFDIELDENFEFSEEKADEWTIPNSALGAVDKHIAMRNLLESSLTVGSFNNNSAGIRLSENVLSFNLSTSTNIPSVGFMDISGKIGISAENKKLKNELVLLTIQNSVNNIHWKLGKFRKSWGDVDGASVLDIINPAKTILSPTLPGMELPSGWLTEATFFQGKNTSDFFASFKTDSESSGFEFGLKSSFEIENGQISFYAASLYPRVRVTNIATGTSHLNRYKLLGFSVQQNVKNLLINFDLAQKFDLNRSTLDELKEFNRIDGATSVEYAPNPYDKWFLKIEASAWEDSNDSYYIPNAPALVKDANQSLHYNLAYSKSTHDQKLDGTLSLGGNGKENSFHLSGESTYSISDSTKISANFLFLDIRMDDSNSFISNSNWINFGITKYF